MDELRKGGPVTIVTLGTSLTGGRWRWPDVLIGEWVADVLFNRLTTSWQQVMRNGLF